MGEELAWADATGQAELVRKGDATPTELLEAALARIDKLNPELNAVIHRLDEKAEAAIVAGLPDGPFTGVPFLVKDGVCHTAGDPFHCGMQVLKDAKWTEQEDTVLAQRYRAAGFVFCGKTNLPELATSVTTEPVAYGATKNPWDTSRSPGGSSGGAAAAVASGMVPVAHGNDMGGSIRFPSSACGLVGLKPTRARTTLAPDLGEYWGPLTHEHVLTRSVRDSARVLDAVHGPAPGDPYTAPPPARPYAEEVGADPGALRIGFRTRGTGDNGESHPDCFAAVQGVARMLESLGHHVEPATVEGLDDPRIDAGFPIVYAATIDRDRERWSSRLGRPIAADELEPLNALGCEMAAGINAVQYVAALDDLQAWSRGVAAWWADGNDVLVTPTMSEPPVRLGELSAGAPDQLAVMMRMGRLTTFTGPFNVTGQPAISLPLHWNGDGLPIGVQLIAAYGREDVLFRLGSQLEQAQPWVDRHPPVSA
ncbi:MAG TPA: amidase [Acidimicrobiia bacterium]|nr:amidase [Acidimicrobiia bacterium]